MTRIRVDGSDDYDIDNGSRSVSGALNIETEDGDLITVDVTYRNALPFVLPENGCVGTQIPVSAGVAFIALAFMIERKSKKGVKL